MKVQDFAYNVAVRTMELLEHHQGYKVPEDTRKEVTAAIRKELHEIMKRS